MLGGGVFFTLVNTLAKKFKKIGDLDIKPVDPWKGLRLLKRKDRILGHLKLSKKQKFRKCIAQRSFSG